MITASIVTYKTNISELKTVLDCVIDSSIEQIYIIDNSPTDELRSFEVSSPKIIYHFGQGNIGYGAGHNIAMRLAIQQKAEYHLVINPDIYFDPVIISKLILFMDEYKNVGQLMPRVVYPDGRLQYLCKLLPTPMNLIGRKFLKEFAAVQKHDEHFEMRRSGYDKIMNVPFLSGCFMFLRVEALEQVGLFDEKRFFMYCEDVDLCRRIGEKYRTVFYPYVQIVHNHNKESFRNRKMMLVHIRSAITYFNKWGWIFDSKRRNANKKALKEI